MSDVKRYFPEPLYLSGDYTAQMGEAPDGDYVCFDDYERLKAERDAAVAERDRESALALQHALAVGVAVQDISTLKAERDAALETIRYVERWACHHGTKPHVTAEQALSMIQHYPPIKEITRSYADGVVPDTPDPWAERDAAVAALKRYGQHDLDCTYSEDTHNDGPWPCSCGLDAARGEK